MVWQDLADPGAKWNVIFVTSCHTPRAKKGEKKKKTRTGPALWEAGRSSQGRGKEPPYFKHCKWFCCAKCRQLHILEMLLLSRERKFARLCAFMRVPLPFLIIIVPAHSSLPPLSKWKSRGRAGRMDQSVTYYCWAYKCLCPSKEKILLGSGCCVKEEDNYTYSRLEKLWPSEFSCCIYSMFDVGFSLTDLQRGCETSRIHHTSSLWSCRWRTHRCRVRGDLAALLPCPYIAECFITELLWLQCRLAARTWLPRIWGVLSQQILCWSFIQDNVETIIFYFGFSISETPWRTPANYSTACFLLRSRDFRFYGLRLLNKWESELPSSQLLIALTTTVKHFWFLNADWYWSYF